MKPLEKDKLYVYQIVKNKNEIKSLVEKCTNVNKKIVKYLDNYKNKLKCTDDNNSNLSAFNEIQNLIFSKNRVYNLNNVIGLEFCTSGYFKIIFGNYDKFWKYMGYIFNGNYTFSLEEAYYLIDKGSAIILYEGMALSTNETFCLILRHICSYTIIGFERFLRRSFVLRQTRAFNVTMDTLPPRFEGFSNCSKLYDGYRSETNYSKNKNVKNDFLMQFTNLNFKTNIDTISKMTQNVPENVNFYLGIVSSFDVSVYKICQINL
ncbi:hypothetical protein A3Q56_04743 [Intoshia linei]|uniref:tRNA-splicing endonuclease subunit Sen54 N-terminal domain-containing protein n=1 Tax=Intoshia linei TaxID=1819745 RepID=A0A177B262_9BILA|nr:hypothetical protein A3Q56_04743 [Intoshia linei]